MLLGRCEFGKDDYSFNIVNIPSDQDSKDFEDGQDFEHDKVRLQEILDKPKKQKNNPSLFDL
jgi:adenine-specific DNA-methyltransferase